MFRGSSHVYLAALISLILTTITLGDFPSHHQTEFASILTNTSPTHHDGSSTRHRRSLLACEADGSQCAGLLYLGSGDCCNSASKCYIQSGVNQNNNTLLSSLHQSMWEIEWCVWGVGCMG